MKKLDRFSAARHYRSVVYFLVLSAIGVFVFFIPIANKNVLLTLICDMIHALGMDYHKLIVLVVVVVSLIHSAIHMVKTQEYNAYLFVEYGVCLCSLILLIMICMGVNLDFIASPHIGGQAFSLAYSVFITIFVSGFFVVFILESGLVEFISVLLEPYMQRLFRIPGRAAIDCLSSFVASASVGIYITNRLYNERKYTSREACIVATCFSVMSLGFMATLSNIVNINHLYWKVVVCSFLTVVVLAIICCRIPPLARISDTYIDRTSDKKMADPAQNITITYRLKVAFAEGCKKADKFTMLKLRTSFVQAYLFAQKITALLVAPTIIVLTISEYTCIFEHIGLAVEPLLKLLQLPNPHEIAPAVLLGITEVSLPAISISSLQVAEKSRFFVVVLSIVQIIYFTESANVILSSSLPLNAKELVKIFFIRTILAMPIVAIFAHMFC